MRRTRQEGRRVRAAAWAGLLVLAGCSKETPEQGRAGGPAVVEPASEDALLATASLPPRHAIAGIPGFQIASRITFAAEPDRSHTLMAIFLFPERVRLHLATTEGERIDRVLAYRCGARGYFIDEGLASSRELTGDELRGFCLQTELRRALFLWPDGFAWLGEGGERTAEIPPLGKLVATLGPDGRPSSMRALDAAGKGTEQLQAVTWKARLDRHFPAHLEVHSEGQPVWSEDVVSVETRLSYVDAFFLPPDRRKAAGEAKDAVRAIDLPAVLERRVPLPATPPATWASAKTAQARERAAVEAQGMDLLEGEWIELDPRGAPRALLLRAADQEPPPEGWTRAVEGPAWELVVQRIEELDPARLASLRQRAGNQPLRLHAEFIRAGDKAETIRLIASPDVAR